MAKPNKLGFGSGGGAKRLLSGAGGSIGAGHGAAGSVPQQLAPQSAKKAAKDLEKGDNATQQHDFGTHQTQHGRTAAKGGGNSVPRRTAPGA